VASYAAPADLVARYDANRLGQLVRDDKGQSTASQLVSDTNIAAALADASGQIEAAIIAGRRYDPTDLSSLTGNTLNLLIRLTCDLAYGYLIRRRGFPEDEAGRLAPAFREAQAILAQLRNGDQVFGVPAVLDAKVTTTDEMGKLTVGSASGSLGVVGGAFRYFGIPAGGTNVATEF
jgi:phage gp36-like protein